LKDVLRALHLAREQLVDLALLVGTDYHPGVPGIGPRTALKLLQAHGRIEDVIAATPGRDWSALGITSHNQPFSAFIDASRARFLQPDVTTRVKDVEWQTADAGVVRQFLLERHSFSPDLVEKALASMGKVKA
jgi:flap endonuclease-1